MSNNDLPCRDCGCQHHPMDDCQPKGSMKNDNPFCDACKEKYCVVSFDGTCTMIRAYLNQYKEGE